MPSVFINIIFLSLLFYITVCSSNELIKRLILNKALEKRVSINLDSENQIQNELFEDLISEIFRSQAILNDFVIHYDSFTATFINNIIKKTNKINNSTNIKSRTLKREEHENKEIKMSSPVTIIFNYDYILSTTSIHNVSRRYSLHFVSMTQPLRFDSQMREGLKSSDIIIFLCQRYYGSCKTAFDEGGYTINRFFLERFNFLKKVFLTLVIEFSNNDIRLYEVCYYCGASAKKLSLKYKERLRPAVKASEKNLSSEILKMVNSKIWLFNGHSFKVAFHIEDTDNFECQNARTVSVQEPETIVSCDNTLGFEGKVLAEITKRVNISFDLVYFEKNNDGPYETLVNVVQQGKADWALGSITMAASRMNRVDFSTSLCSVPFRVVYGAETTFLKEGLKLIYVFSVFTWILVVATLVVQAGVVYFSNKISPENRTESCCKIFRAVGIILVEQSNHINYKMFGGRVLFLWLLCSINISTLYKAKLSSFITKPPRGNLLKLDQLVKDGYGLTSLKNGLIEQTLSNSSDTTFQTLSRRVSFGPDICVNLKKIIKNKQIVIYEQDGLYRQLNELCRQNGLLTKSDLMKLRVSQDDIFPSSHAWAFQKETPYKNFLDSYIFRFHQNGLTTKWSDQPRSNYSVFFNGNSIVVDDIEIMELKQKFYGQYVLWIVGIVLSCSCFVVEIVINFFKQRT